MFPYLKSKDEFIRDCENIRYNVAGEGKPSLPYVFTERDNENIGFFSRIRGCSHDNRFCEGQCSSTDCECIEKDEVFAESCKSCTNISEVVVQLTENVNRASWRKIETNGIGDVSFLQIQSWCQSVCVYMHDVVKHTKNDNLYIGLEYYSDRMETNSYHCRADVVIVGYGGDGRGKVLIIELKQHDNEHFKEDAKRNAANQVKDYCNSLKASMSDDVDIDVIPCVYFHNYTKAECIRDTDEVCVCYGGTVQCKDKTDGIIEMSHFIDEIMSQKEPEYDAKNIIIKMKSSIKTLSIQKLGEIMYGMDSGSSKVCLEDIEKILRPDQSFVYKAIAKQIKNNEKGMHIVSGAPGSGKTVLAALFIRYCVENNKRVVFVYHGSAPVKAIEETLNTLSGKGEESDENQKLKEDWEHFVKIVHVNNVEKENIEADVLIFDEFHRIQKDSADNVDGIFAPVKCIILMVDRLQAVQRTDAGTKYIEAIISGNKESTYVMHNYHLWSQFRCNNSEGFVTCVEQMLQMHYPAEDRYVVRKKNNNQMKFRDLDFDVRVIDKSDKIIEDLYRNENVVFLTNNREHAKDIFGNESLFSKNKHNGFISARDQNGLIEVGTCYRVQGVEYDEILVVLDDSIDYIDGKICFTKEYIEELWKEKIPADLKEQIQDKYENELEPSKRFGTWERLKEAMLESNGNKSDQEQCDVRCRIYEDFFAEYIEDELNLAKNRYRVLITRGIKKCYIYVMNDGLRRYFKSFE